MSGNSGIVAREATQLATLKTGELALLGLFGPERAMGALVLLPGGKVRKVAPGDRLAQGTVVGIDANGLMLERGGQTRRLVMPGG